MHNIQIFLQRTEQQILVKDQIASQIAKTISLFSAQRRSSQTVQKQHQLRRAARTLPFHANERLLRILPEGKLRNERRREKETEPPRSVSTVHRYCPRLVKKRRVFVDFSRTILDTYLGRNRASLWVDFVAISRDAIYSDDRIIFKNFVP